MKAKVVEWKKTIEQDGDCWNGDQQNLEVSMTDGGGGPYFVIETARWAFNDLNELVEMLTAAGVVPTHSQEGGSQGATASRPQSAVPERSEAAT